MPVIPGMVWIGDHQIDSSGRSQKACSAARLSEYARTRSRYAPA
jgi:hypothetical protein